MINLTLRDGILASLKSGRDYHLQEIYAAVDPMPVVTEKGRKIWKNGQLMLQCEIRSLLKKMKDEGVVLHVGYATYRLA